MASGVAVSDSCKTMYMEVKMKQKNQVKRKFGVFKISDDLKQIEVDTDRCVDHPEEAEPCQQQEDGRLGEEEGFKQLIRDLPPDDARYILYDYEFQDSFGAASKMVLVSWVPENVSIKKKMLYAASKDALKKCFADCHGDFHADCPDDLCHSQIVAKLRKI